MQEKYGFVYIWYDRKRKMYYIGSHWGAEDDGYICSSNRMRDAYRRRPEDFKRRILNRFYDKSETFQKEREWLKAVNKQDRYYNHVFDVYHWLLSKETSEIAKAKMSKSKMGRTSPRKGIKLSEETKEKLRVANTGKKYSDETKRKKSEAMKGKVYSPESIKKSSLNRMKTYELISPQGELNTISNLREFCKLNNLNYTNAHALATGRYYKETYKGWRKCR